MKLKYALAAGLLAATATQIALADIHVGVTTSLTGPGASIGIPVRNAITLWPTEIAGQKLIVQVLDDAGDPTQATKNGRRFAEEGADLIVGSANTPATIALAQVAAEAKIMQLSPSPAELPAGKDYWTFRVVMNARYYTDGLIEHMKKHGVKSVAFLGLSDAYGESYLQALKEKAPAAGIKISTIERFARADTSIAGQSLGVLASKPDAVVIVAVGAGAAMPQKAMIERGYKGKIYHTPASVSPDFLRLAGKDAKGALVVSGPEQVPEQLPASHPGKQNALKFVQSYEAKYGPGSRTQFAAHIYDFAFVLEKIIPIALQKAKPGTPEFRTALRDTLETVGGITVTKGVLHYTPEDHWGFGPDARVMLTPDGNDWKLVD
ncbi:ABC transporter substrate-binding protein [Eoetvoesiella caeni]|uniref:Branched-chain amino acid transport system substrate-binding protein n=1 Tax=Eoetvoesiella caeni TaxID=645616 RepID=A0A366HB79_9BURK|nr:ABC transporter substrate-binding protein [Eoetvoesiella caeni]MCI2809207.1 ABC transporter substrate-binding protein [Eoetvoesiella caeni]NYT54349.1 ABC transporter substrate-binding protein [Eoetvoesiella caeni]RBP39465.1 branched-chain amino acid transport system substrate-binding protein [Eoetvoesiella caeni]